MELTGIRIKRNEDGGNIAMIEPRYNLATKVMSNGVEVIVATDRNARPGEPEYLRLLSSTVTRPITLAPHTLSNYMSMLLTTENVKDGDHQLISSLHTSNLFATRTYYTTYTYLSTIVQNGETEVSTKKTTISNVRTEEVSSSERTISPTSTRELLLTDVPSMQTEVFHTTYTYLNTILDGEQPLVMTSRKTVSNTVTAISDYFNLLEPSEAYPATNTYLRTVDFTKTITDGLDSRIVSTKDVLTQVVITDPIDRETVVKPMTTEVTKTYFVTYTYFSTYIEGDQTKVKSDVSVSSDVTIEKFYVKPKKTTVKFTETAVNPLTKSAQLNIFATKTYLTTFTYFTTLLHGPAGEKAETKITTRTRVMQNIVTETLSPNHFNADYLIELRNSLAHQSNGSVITTATLRGGEKIEITAFKGMIPAGMTYTYAFPSVDPASPSEINNLMDFEVTKTKVTGSDIEPTSTEDSTVYQQTSAENEITAEALVGEENHVIETKVIPSVTMTRVHYSNHNTDRVDISPTEVEESSSTTAVQEETEQESANKKKPQKTPEVPVSNFLNLTSLGINGINVLGPVFNAMAELINNNINNKGKVNATVPVKREPVLKKPAASHINVNPLLNFVSGLKATPKIEPKHKSTTARTPVYIPVGSFAEDHEVAESQSNVVVAANLPPKWLDTQGKNMEKNRVENGITILEGGIPISPGQIITTNSDVIIGRPGSSGPRPPNFAVKSNIPIGMKPPPLPGQISLEHPLEDVIGQHSTIKSVKPIDPHRQNLRQKHKPHDSGDLDLNPPPAPPGVHAVHRPITINHKPHEIVPYKPEHAESNIIPIPVRLVENYVNLPVNQGNAAQGQINVIKHPDHVSGILAPSLPNDHIPLVVPELNSHMEDRSTGHPLLVNIQPSQVANVVIPPGSTAALIINENQHSLKGEVIDDPSPHPEPETVGFVGAEPVLRLENGDVTPPLHLAGRRPVIDPTRPHHHHPHPNHGNKIFLNAAAQNSGHHHVVHSSNKQKINGAVHEENNLKGVNRIPLDHNHRVKDQPSRVANFNAGHHYRDDHLSFIANGPGLHSEHKNPVKNGIYVDVSPPSHQPMRDFVHGGIHQGTPAGDNFLKHQTGHVHDVPLNPQVQLGVAINDQSVKETINRNKFEKVNQQHDKFRKPLGDGYEAINPPPPPGKFNNNRRPAWQYSQYPSDFMVPPPHLSHRPNHKPSPDAPGGPIMIPVGAGAPEQPFPYPRPEDIVIVPHPQKNHPDLDISELNDPLHTEDGEEIQESNSRPLLPGQLPAELQNKTLFERPLTNYRPSEINSEIRYGVNRPNVGLQNVKHQNLQNHFKFRNHSTDVSGVKLNYGSHFNGDIYNEAEQIFGSKLKPGPSQRPGLQVQELPNNVRVEGSVDAVGLYDSNTSGIDKPNADGGRKPVRPIPPNVRHPLKPFPGPGIHYKKGSHESSWITHGAQDRPQSAKRPVHQDSMTSSSVWSTVKDKDIPSGTKGQSSGGHQTADQEGSSVQNVWSFADSKEKIHPNHKPFHNGTQGGKIALTSTTQRTKIEQGTGTNNRHKEPTDKNNRRPVWQSGFGQDQSVIYGNKQVSQQSNIKESVWGIPGRDKVRVPPTQHQGPTDIIQKPATVKDRVPQSPVSTIQQSSGSGIRVQQNHGKDRDRKPLGTNAHQPNSGVWPQQKPTRPSGQPSNVQQTSASEISWAQSKPTTEKGKIPVEQGSVQTKPERDRINQGSVHNVGGSWAQKPEAERVPQIPTHQIAGGRPEKDRIPTGVIGTVHHTSASGGVRPQKPENDQVHSIPVTNGVRTQQKHKQPTDKIRVPGSIWNQPKPEIPPGPVGSVHQVPIEVNVWGQNPERDRIPQGSVHQVAVSGRPQTEGSGGTRKKPDKVRIPLAPGQQSSASESIWSKYKPNADRIRPSQGSIITGQQAAGSEPVWAKPSTERVRLPSVSSEQSNDWIGTKPTRLPSEDKIKATPPSKFPNQNPPWLQKEEEIYRNRTSGNKVETTDFDGMLVPPKKSDEEVMGLSPPPPERPRRPQRPLRPKPPFRFDATTTQRTPVVLENDFPPVRSPEFNKKPIKPQDIFPPKLPDNFVHRVPVRTQRPPTRPPVTSLSINVPDIPEQQQTSDTNEIHVITDINGHSKPVVDDLPKPETPVQHPKPTPATTELPSTDVEKIKIDLLEDEGDVIRGSETVFEPDEFNKYRTPIIKDTTTRKMVTTLISTGTTTIFGDFYTPMNTQGYKTAEGKKPETQEAYTTTLTVTTTMTTVVHSLGQKPSTETLVLTKTIVSTVIDKITETQTLVKPTTATVTQTHTIATTKTALIVPTPTKYPAGTLKPEIFVADPHSKDTMTISVSTSMNKDEKRKHGTRRPETTDNDSILVVMTNKHPKVNLSGNFDGAVETEEDSGLFLGGIYTPETTKRYKIPLWRTECVPECKATRNERCQKLDGAMKCVCRPGFARMFPDRPCMPTYTYNMKVVLDMDEREDLSQSESTNYVKMKSKTKEGLDRLIMQSDLRDVFHGVLVNGFQPANKKTMVDFYVQLSENTDEKKLTDVFRKTLRNSNYSLGGTELYAAREADLLEAADFNECLNPKFHDCSENARCFNLKGTYTCSCKEGFTDLSENSQFPGRMCSDMIGCEYCGYHGTCYTRDNDQTTCECFQWYSGERCRINLKVLLIALVTIGSILLALLLICGLLTCLRRKHRSSASRANGSAGYLRYRGPPTQSLDKRAMIATDSSSESSVDNLPYINPVPPPPPTGTLSAKRKPVLRQNMKGPAPRPKEAVEQQDRSVTVMIPRAKYRPVPPMSPLLTMSTFSPDKHIHRTSAQISTEQKLISYLEGNSRESAAAAQVEQRQAQKEYDTPRQSSTMFKKERVFEYEYKTSNMQINDCTSSGERRSSKNSDSERRFRRHSDSTHLNCEKESKSFQHRKYSAGALVSAGYEVSATVEMRHNDFDSEDDQSGILNTSTMKSNRSQFTTLNRTGDHKTMSEARSYDETTVHPPTRTLKTNYSSSSPSSRINNDEGHTMVERDLGSTFVMAESHLFKPDRDRGSDISTFDSL